MSDIKLSNITNPDYFGKERKIGKHSRKLYGETFTSPRVILPPDYNGFIGKCYRLYEADVEVTEELWSYIRVIKGKALILVIPESIEEEMKGYDEDTDWEDWEEELEDE